jgi:hypothetical protein
MLKGWAVMDGSIPSLTECGWYYYESKVWCRLALLK